MKAESVCVSGHDAARSAAVRGGAPAHAPTITLAMTMVVISRNIDLIRPCSIQRETHARAATSHARIRTKRTLATARRNQHLAIITFNDSTYDSPLRAARAAANACAPARDRAYRRPSHRTNDDRRRHASSHRRSTRRAKQHYPERDLPLPTRQQRAVRGSRRFTGPRDRRFHCDAAGNRDGNTRGRASEVRDDRDQVAAWSRGVDRDCAGYGEARRGAAIETFESSVFCNG